MQNLSEILAMAWVFALCVVVSALDSLCDAHFGDSPTSKWRRPRRINLGILSRTTDLWHLAKWGRFYGPLVTVMGLVLGRPWTSWGVAGFWIVTILASWWTWRRFSPWGSMWLGKNL